jgi:hypothetical protein
MASSEWRIEKSSAVCASIRHALLAIRRTNIKESVNGSI